LKNKKIKIIRIFSRLNIGGASVHVILLTSGISIEKFRSVLITGLEDSHEGNMNDYSNEKKVKPIVVKEMGRNISIINDCIALIKIIKIIIKERPDIIDTHSAKAGFLGRLAALYYNYSIINIIKKNHVKTIHTFHGNIFSGYFGKFKTKIFVLIERLLALFTDKIICLTNQQRNEILNLKIGNQKKVITIPLGLDLKRFKKIKDYKSQLRQELCLNEETLLIGIVARLVPIKNHKLIINTIENLKNKIKLKDFKLIIIGDGELKLEIQKFVDLKGLNNNILFLGFRKDLEKIYADLDIVALSSKNEGLPVSLIEALACGIPVISTDVGGVSDLFEVNYKKRKQYLGIDDFLVTDYGILVQNDNVKLFTKGLMHLINNANLRGRMGLNGIRNIYNKYDISRLINDMETIYSVIIK